MRDVLVTPGLEEGTFALVDIDARRLELAHQIAEKLIAATGRRWNVEASTERTERDRRDGLPDQHASKWRGWKTSATISTSR